MITIDWKERLTNDALDYADKKLTKQDYDFDIIFNWYPERINGHVPAEVIQLVARVIAQKIGRLHEQYLPFYQYLWEKKGENGKLAFATLISRFLPKKPALYTPLLDKAMQKASIHDIGLLFERVILPLYKKETEPFLSKMYPWLESSYEPLRKQALIYLVRMLKLKPEIIPPVIKHLQNRWVIPSADLVTANIGILKAVWKLKPDLVMDIFREYKTTRDPQTVEILCGAITSQNAELIPIVENWTHSGNARLKKAATTAFKILNKKKA